MYRIKLDPVTNKVEGYEVMSGNLIAYDTDILCEKPPVIGAYYENGEFIIESRDDYHSKKFVLQAQIQAKKSVVDNVQQLTVNALLNDTLDEVKQQINTAKTELEALTAQLDLFEEEHSKAIAEFYAAENARRDSSVSPEYYSAVCLIARDENPYITEWVKWHLDLGFDKLFIYDNNSEIPLASTLADELSEAELARVEVIDFGGKHKDAQTECYNQFLSDYGNRVRWAAFIDTDEFIRITDGKAENINGYLSKREAFTSIKLDFIEYNANGLEHYDSRPVRERFTVPATVNKDIYFKNIVQPARITGMNIHYPVFDKAKHSEQDKDGASIVCDHYYTKSWDEWCAKIERGSCYPNWLRKKNEFFDYNPDMIHLKTEENEVQGYDA